MAALARTAWTREMPVAPLRTIKLSELIERGRAVGREPVKAEVPDLVEPIEPVAVQPDHGRVIRVEAKEVREPIVAASAVTAVVPVVLPAAVPAAPPPANTDGRVAIVVCQLAADLLSHAREHEKDSQALKRAVLRSIESCLLAMSAR